MQNLPDNANKGWSPFQRREDIYISKNNSFKKGFGVRPVKRK